MGNYLFLVFLVPLIMDVVGTVTGQKKEYWSSKYKKYNEAVPFIDIILGINPLLFILVCLVIWIPITYWLTHNLPHPLNLWASLALFAAHATNSTNWLRKTQWNLGIFTGKDKFSMALALIPIAIYLLFIGYIATWGLLQYFS
ncbi:hypothetical protein A2803_02160 [Candidatus Woesebacteria bacterium RIFCSPHIGHO2_01_FULL_44_21]|uniref:DUF5658 domain-containing protein n=1 Tax=Candidatus Woesebacteria bacterium RIFCSPHIGHO2_01_FULL_44_21 TaxID=1802503 RepID=A0A1F7YXR1_9BACT|nr:MAG: hypothetical protein A2803_02160 [Candidatus Woesebacteria bacterium RIFCSPHIGHO2_01_FULL_44_21]OGM69485.1 MAG: hypothetical protein A2897_03995 [Candidatus Woesebacteria bacterium RIFCSPLOWO2_01_FULL_44_24b]